MQISFTVNGTVQGVNFRSWTEDKARGLGVTGFVKNASDGTVCCSRLFEMTQC